MMWERDYFSDTTVLRGSTSDCISLSKVSLGLLAPQAQLARRESPAVMESRAQQERRVNKVSLAPASQQESYCLLRDGSAVLTEHRGLCAELLAAPKT